MLERVLIEVRGVVQGVGFRPFVHAVATALDLRGFVQNRGAHVLIDVEGDAAAVRAFEQRLRTAPPPRASIEHLDLRSAPVAHRASFAIAASDPSPDTDIRIAADIGTCDACRAELFDPDNRRFRYPFINCSWCGPRYTIVTGVPYDRARTTMAAFAMCAACRAEYEDPSNRRFHAEPIACAACGPALATGGGGPRGERALRAAVEALTAGRIVAVKGLGGYHLACDAESEAAVAALRARKGRDAKPLAVMLSDERAGGLLDRPAIRAALGSPARPIALIDRTTWNATGAPALAPSVAPGCPAVGVMLPYTPLHHLLLHDARRALVMTSGNRTDEPIAHDDGDAQARLGGIADLFLLHDRPIHVRCDDSIVAVGADAAACVRRGRGFAPAALALAEEAPVPILAVGGHLKNTFCLMHGRRAFLSPHVGDLDHAAASEALRAAIAHYTRVLGIEPAIVAHDLHPEYRSTRLAAQLDTGEAVPVQHHHAHVLACAAEHGLTEPVIGIAFDGAGLGTDGAIWGGEALVVDGPGWRRAAHLACVALPGGDRAAREPWRMAVAHAVAAGAPESSIALAWLRDRVPGPAFRGVRRLAELAPGRGTSSVGRLFDAVAALAAVRDRCAFEGQAAMELEALASPAGEARYTFELDTASDPWQFDAAPVIRAIVRDVAAGASPPLVASAFHEGLAAVIAETGARLARQTGIRRVALTGGVFQNVRLAARAAALLSARGVEVLQHRHVPCNDGGLALGQAVAAARLVRAGLLQERHACA